MKLRMPQELEVWIVLPAIRKELAKVLVSEYHLSQRNAASAIGVTESAVSQYFKEKRGNDIVFDEDVLERINHIFCTHRIRQVYFTKSLLLCCPIN